MRVALSLLAVAALVVLAPFLAPAGMVEAWVRTVFPLWAAVMARVHDTVPWSLSATLTAALLAAALAALAWPGRRLRRFGTAALATGSLLAITFVVAWGAAYQRVPLAEQLAVPERGADLPSLMAGLEHVVTVVAGTAPARPLADADTGTRSAAVAAAAACVVRADAAVTGRAVVLPERVRVLPAGTLLRLGYGGVSSPWLLEPHVDAALPHAAFIATATHELAHAAGWAGEADTDALSVLAGLGCDHATVRYASALHAVQLLANAVRLATPPGHPARAHADELVATLPEAARADRRALTDAIARHRVEAAARVSERVYDAYLRSQGVEAGVADYAAAGALVAAALAACDDSAPWPWCDADAER
jgi:hypothetical protein